MDFINETGEEVYSGGDGKFWKTVGMLNPIAAPIIVGKNISKKRKEGKNAKVANQDKTPQAPPTSSGGVTPPTQQGGMSKGLKIGLIVGGIAVVGVILVLVMKRKNK